MSEAKIEIHTEGGPVITGGTFTGVEFVAQKYVYKNDENEELKMKNEEFSSFGGEADILHSSFPKNSSFGGEADILHSSYPKASSFGDEADILHSSFPKDSSFGGEADILHSSFPKNSSFGGEADILHSSFPKGSSFPSLSTPLALEVMERMVSAGVLNEDWQPQGLSNAEKGVLASCLATRLDIAHVWQTFSTLWGMKPETLRTAFNKGMEQRKTAAFLERVKKVMSA